MAPDWSEGGTMIVADCSLNICFRLFFHLGQYSYTVKDKAIHEMKFMK